MALGFSPSGIKRKQKCPFSPHAPEMSIVKGKKLFCFVCYCVVFLPSLSSQANTLQETSCFSLILLSQGSTELCPKGRATRGRA